MKKKLPLSSHHNSLRLYSRFRRGREWWDLHELARKTFLCSALMFISPDALRMPFAVVFCLLSIVSLSFWHPHKNNIVFKVAEIAFCATTIQFISGLSLKAFEGMPHSSEEWIEAFGTFLIIVDVFTFSMVLFAIALLGHFLLLKIQAQTKAENQNDNPNKGKTPARTKRYSLIMQGSGEAGSIGGIQSSDPTDESVKKEMEDKRKIAEELENELLGLQTGRK
jgi:hypothetical protein